jgi:hypothetical protein
MGRTATGSADDDSRLHGRPNSKIGLPCVLKQNLLHGLAGWTEQNFDSGASPGPNVKIRALSSSEESSPTDDSAALDPFLENSETLEAALASEAEKLSPSDTVTSAGTIPANQEIQGTQRNQPLPARKCVSSAEPRLPTKQHTSASRSTSSNICTVCDLSFKSSEDLALHARNAFHRIYICQVVGCGRSYYRRDVYIRHKSTHRQGDLHVCSYCGNEGREKGFKRKDHLKQHYRNCHGVSGCPPLPIKPDEFEQEPFEWDFNFPSPMVYDQCSMAGSMDFMESFSRADGVAYSSGAVKELERALQVVTGDNSDELQMLKARLDLHNRPTTEQLAQTLRKLLIQGSCCADPGEPPLKAAKRKAER